MDSLFSKIHPLLPIFKIPFKKGSIIYTPGRFIILNDEEIKVAEDILLDKPLIFSEILKKQVDWITEQAVNTDNKRKSFVEKPFSPKCLTIYVSNDCNLNCTYCNTWKDNRYKKGSLIDINIVAAAARLVASNCLVKSKTFVFVLHGGGEPTYHWSHMVNIFEQVREIATKLNINFYSYVATNGILSKEKARWLSRNINLIGVSCDGPASFQNLQRPIKYGLPSFSVLEKAIQYIRQAGGHFNISATITPELMNKQTEIITYFAQELHAKILRFEPVYLSKERSFSPDDADKFVFHYLSAEKKAAEFGCNLSFSGVRPEELHGTYCDVLRNTIRLRPDGLSTNCFCDINDDQNITGHFDNSKQEFIINDSVLDLKKMAINFPPECNSCINVYHCSRGCPDFCTVMNNSPTSQDVSKLNAFRCNVHKQLAVEWIKQKANHIREREITSIDNQ